MALTKRILIQAERSYGLVKISLRSICRKIMVEIGKALRDYRGFVGKRRGRLVF